MSFQQENMLETPSNTFDFKRSLEKVRHWLPSQNPIKDFIHHNTLHAFQNLDFDDAVVEASGILGSRVYLSLGEYQKMGEAGQISEAILFQELRETLPPSLLSQSVGDGLTGESFLQHALWEYQEHADLHCAELYLERQHQPIQDWKALTRILKPKPPLRKWQHPRSEAIQKSKLALDQTVSPIFIRLLSSYLDQGVCLWEFPHRNLPFYLAVVQLIQKSVFPLARFLNYSEIKNYLEMNAEEAASNLLNQLCPHPPQREDYLREALLANSGWAGMVSELEKNPSLLRDPRPIRLIDFLAVQLLLEFQAFRHERPSRKVIQTPVEQTQIESERWIASVALVLSRLEIKTVSDSLRQVLDWVTRDRLAGVWHRAMEKTLYQSAISHVQANAKRNLKKPADPSISKTISKVTAVFCIDDRECSVRRYLESEDSSIATDATAGFFGMDFVFQSLRDSAPVKLCPVPVTPKYLVLEKRKGNSNPEFRKYFAKIQAFWRDLSSSFFLGWAVNTVSSPWVFAMLVLHTFKPKWLQKFNSKVPVEAESELDFIRKNQTDSGQQYVEGYSFGEMADRVQGLLKSTGIIQRMSPMIVIVAHGSSSSNNPYFSAYDCGACSGRPGAANAKTFALMANHPEVRKILETRGVLIPKETVFVGAFHDTAKDLLSFFDTSVLHPFHQGLLEEFKNKAYFALKRNAKERSRRFETVPLSVTPQKAHHEVQHRAISWLEPRPELNHATNSLCIVGRRYLTQNLFLDRRSFLQSYNPELDDDGSILKGILSAVVPVCAGINLEYLFSRVDNEVYGSGSKLPHNVASLIGVMNGVDSDLRTGLPKQMIEIHDPIRCLFIVEKNPDQLHSLLKNNPLILDWFEKRWAFLVAVNPSDLQTYQYQPRKGFQPFLTDLSQVKTILDVGEYVSSTRESLHFGLIEPLREVR